MDAKDLLLKDLELFEEALGRNEEIGEKRFSFFVTLVTAVAGGLGAFYTRQGAKDWDPNEPHWLIFVACVILAVVGFLSYLRMLHRNRVTDQFKKTTKYIRNKYTAAVLDPSFQYQVPVPARSKKKVEKLREEWFRGGYAETMAVLEGIIVAVLVWAYNPLFKVGAIFCGLILTVVLWWVAAQREKSD